jgi:hypothetical protein
MENGRLPKLEFNTCQRNVEIFVDHPRDGYEFGTGMGPSCDDQKKGKEWK